MVLRYSIASGNWSANATWDGAASVPGAGDTVEIRNGHTVTIDAEIAAISTCTVKSGGILKPAFSMVTSAFANIVLDAGGKLYASRTATSFLRCAGTITANGAPGVDYGTDADPLSDNTKAAAVEFVCTSDNQSSLGFVLGADNALSMKGATRVQSSTLASLASIGANTIVLAEGMALRPGTLAQAWAGLADFIIVGHTPIQTGNGAQGDEVDIYLVAGYDAGSKTVTLGDAGLGNSDWPRGGVTPTWNTIHQTTRLIGTPVTLLGSNIVIHGSAHNLRPARGIDCASKFATIQNVVIGWCYYGIIYNYGTITSCNPSGCTNGIHANYGTITSCNPSGCTNGIIYNYGTITSCNPSGCTNGIYYNYGTITSCNPSGCTYGIYANYGTITSCNPSGCTYGIIYNYGTITDSDLSGSTNANGYSQAGSLWNCKFGAAVQFIGYNSTSYRRPWQFFESIDHDQVSGAYKAWVLGGIVTKAANVVPSGKTYSYEHACESASYPCFRQLVYTMKRYERMHYRTFVRKEVSMTYRPRIQIIDFFADPLVDAANVVLAETIMPDSTGTWEVLDCYYFNNSDMPKKVLLRTLAMNATGVVYFYPSIILNSDNIVTCDSEGMV